MIECYIGLGANLGDRMGNLSLAVAHLAQDPAMFLRRLSRVYQTEPVGPPQPRYLNAVAQVDTVLSARALVRLLLGIEERMGRVRRERWAAREIDLDLLLFGDRQIDSLAVQVPHPRLQERAFVLVPLCELAPRALHPGLRLTLDDLRLRLPPEELASVHPVGQLRRRVELEEPVDASDPSVPPPPAAGG
ncbi:MAG: hypothetical protein NVS2B9_20680 [Myxococcales bacterium]